VKGFDAYISIHICAILPYSHPHSSGMDARMLGMTEKSVSGLNTDQSSPP